MFVDCSRTRLTNQIANQSPYLHFAAWALLQYLHLNLCLSFLSATQYRQPGFVIRPGTDGAERAGARGVSTRRTLHATHGGTRCLQGNVRLPGTMLPNG